MIGLTMRDDGLQRLVRVAATILIASTCSSFAEDRYPIHLPEWIWQDDKRFAAILDPGVAEIFVAEMAKANALYAIDRVDEGYAIEQGAVLKLHAQFSVRDLVRHGDFVVDPVSERSMGVLLDPLFPGDMRPVLLGAVEEFLRLGTDRGVVDAALLDSIEHAEPFPAITDEGYSLYARSLSKPRSPDVFVSHLSSILDQTNAFPPALIISSYVGGSTNVWWGGGAYDFYGAPNLWLTRTNPSGFLYIRLNLDRMAAGEDRRDDVHFWASKIAHEVAHNLGYWHPPYANPAQRDELAPAGRRPFIYAYELALLAAAEDAQP